MKVETMIKKEIEDLPEEIQTEILDYVMYLKQKKVSEKQETALLSENILKRDWLLPEEDEAWKDL
ncbi:MAG: DUF2281 domain-containing protein [Brevinematales bacterium]|nr:DUF2281 domain-containing protein [Brevinematales bacterium]